MPGITQVRLGSSGWQTGYLNPTTGGLGVSLSSGALEFAFGSAGSGSVSQRAAAWNGANYWDYLVGTAGPWDLSTGEIVWHNASWPDWTHVESGAPSSGALRFGVVLYNLQDTDAGNWEIDWGFEVTYSGGVMGTPHVQTYLVNEAAAYSLVDPAINGGGGSTYENIGGTTGPTDIPTPVEMYSWVRLRSAGGLIFYETSRDGSTWSYVHGSTGSAPDLGGTSMPMSSLMRDALQTVGVQFYALRTPGYGSGSWTVESLGAAPYPTSSGDPTSESAWVSYGYNPAGQTGRGEFGPTGVYLGTDQPTPAEVLFPNDVEITQLAVGSNQSAAVSLDGHIYVWGDCALATDQGFFGDQLVPPFDFDPALGDPPLSVRAIAIPTLLTYDEASDVQQVAVGASALFWVRSDHTVWGVGLNGSGEFGTGSSGEYVGSPAQLDVGVDVATLHACLGWPGLFCVGTDGVAYFAGDDYDGMSGNGGIVHAPNQSGSFPGPYAHILQLNFVAVPDISTSVSQLSANGNMALAIAQDGTVWTWGLDLAGLAPGGSPPDYILAPTPLLEATDSTFTQPFVTVSRPFGPSSGSVWGTTGGADSSLAYTLARTLSPPLPVGPDDPGTIAIVVD